MQRLVLMCGLLLWPAAAAQCDDDGANAQASRPQDRLLFPHNFVRGYVDFNVTPPHNEADLGLCSLRPGPPPPGYPECAAYARYLWSGYVEVQPVGRGFLRRLFLFSEPKLFGGENVPSVSYTASPSLILLEQTFGFGWTLPRQLEIRWSNHRVKLFGRYDNILRPYLSNPNGPYGLHSSIGVRWYFGGYGRTMSR